jgi:hypothetical protein
VCCSVVGVTAYHLRLWLQWSWVRITSASTSDQSAELDTWDRTTQVCSCATGYNAQLSEWCRGLRRTCAPTVQTPHSEDYSELLPTRLVCHPTVCLKPLYMQACACKSAQHRVGRWASVAIDQVGSVVSLQSSAPTQNFAE